MKRATKCPGCGEPVSVFAAGCAICGADLEQHRRELDERRVELPEVPRPARRVPFGLDAHVALVALVLVATLLSPFLALLMAAVGAQDRHRNGQTGQRNLFVALALLNLALALVPELQLGLYSLLS